MTKAQKSKLVVVESPNKVKTIEKFLGKGFIVRATVGHIADIPETKGAVDPANGFAARYGLSERGEEVVAQLRYDLHFCDELILATDADREGELIAAHVVEFAEPRVPVRRVTFNAVTKEAVLEALRGGRAIDEALVEAAKTRRVLDRLFGFEVSDVTRKKVRGNATAGRVQSPALRLVVERERERMAFRSAAYWGVEGEAEGGFAFKLVSLAGRRVAKGGDFDANGVLVQDVLVLDESAAVGVANGVSGLTVVSVEHKPVRRGPLAPFTMSTLYQEALNRLGMSTRESRMVSQMLFDKGHITYPRTDVAVHEPASCREIRAEVVRLFGRGAVSPSERFVTSKKKVQGAHEAIRPTNVSARVVPGLGGREAAMYEMVWQRTLASQMADAVGESVSLVLRAGEAEFAASGTSYMEEGYRRVWPVESAGVVPPALTVGEVVSVASAEAKAHATQPPARYTEASLVKELEDLGIGRPSTYASIIAKLRDRYVWSRSGERALIPTVTAFAVHRVLMQGFAPLVDLQFTTEMEAKLDMVAENGAMREELLHEFFFGSGAGDGLAALVEYALVGIDAREMVAFDLGVDPASGEHVVVRPGKLFRGSFSPYVEVGGRRRSVPDALDPAEVSLQWALARLDAPRANRRLLGVDAAGVEVWVIEGRYGPYVSCGRETRGVGEDMTFDAVTLDSALALLVVPKPARRGRRRPPLG
jgi:DNA topoisomerase-1